MAFEAKLAKVLRKNFCLVVDEASLDGRINGEQHVESFKDFLDNFRLSNKRTAALILRTSFTSKTLQIFQSFIFFNYFYLY